jgi:hypothetical protein
MAPASPRDREADPVTDPAAAPGDDTDRRKTELRRRLRARRTTLAATPDRARRDAALVTNLCRYLDTLDSPDGRPAAVAAFAPLPGEPGAADAAAFAFTSPLSSAEASDAAVVDASVEASESAVAVDFDAEEAAAFALASFAAEASASALSVASA